MNSPRPIAPGPPSAPSIAHPASSWGISLASIHRLISSGALDKPHQTNSSCPLVSARASRARPDLSRRPARRPVTQAQPLVLDLAMAEPPNPTQPTQSAGSAAKRGGVARESAIRLAPSGPSLEGPTPAPLGGAQTLTRPPGQLRAPRILFSRLSARSTASTNHFGFEAALRARLASCTPTRTGRPERGHALWPINLRWPARFEAAFCSASARSITGR